MTGEPVAEIVATLSARGETVATAESLTAGAAAARMADVPGASAVLRGGVIVYATDLKTDLAGVDPQVLAEDGPVAARTAEQMARGAARRCGADWALALTGVAGPDGQDGHAPGTVFVAVAGPGPHGQVTVEAPALSGDRAQIRAAAVDAGWDLLSRRLAVGADR